MSNNFQDDSGKFLPPDIKGPNPGYLHHGERISRNARKFGLYDTAGLPLPYSDLASNELSSVAENYRTPTTSTSRVSEPVLFAGLVLEQFGHVLTNSIGRLWALEHLPDDLTLVFTPKRRAHEEFYPFIKPVLEMLGLQNRVRIIAEPTNFDAVYTACDLFGERYGGLGSTEFYSWIDERLPAHMPIRPHRSIYVTRRQLGEGNGRYACEDYLESLLRVEGYEIYSPEKQSLKDQVSTYQSAERLIFSEGSALHLFALVRRPEQRVALIQRRSLLPGLISKQMNNRPGLPVVQIDAIREVFWPPLRSDHLSVSLLDFDRLGAALRENGFIGTIATWQKPSPEQESSSLMAGREVHERMLNLTERKTFLKELRLKQQNKAG